MQVLLMFKLISIQRSLRLHLAANDLILFIGSKPNMITAGEARRNHIGFYLICDQSLYRLGFNNLLSGGRDDRTGEEIALTIFTAQLLQHGHLFMGFYTFRHDIHI